MTPARPTGKASPRPGRKQALAVCSGLPAVELTHPFGDESAVFKVAGKMFSVVSLHDEPGSITLKCDPDDAQGLTGEYDEISPGYHMNKRHWITVTLGPGLPPGLVADLIADSYALVVASLPARARPST